MCVGGGRWEGDEEERSSRAGAGLRVQQKKDTIEREAMHVTAAQKAIQPQHTPAHTQHVGSSPAPNTRHEGPRSTGTRSTLTLGHNDKTGVQRKKTQRLGEEENRHAAQSRLEGTKGCSGAEDAPNTRACTGT